MKNFNLSIFIISTAFIVPSIAAAKNYADFDVCAVASKATIQSAIEGAGGKITRVIDNTYPDEVIVLAKNYPVEASSRNIGVTLYKGRVAYISIGNAGDMVQGIETKYGNNFTVTKKEEKVGITTSHHFKEPTDPELDLSISQFEVAGNKGTFFSVNYACKELYQQVEKARQEYASSAVKK